MTYVMSLFKQPIAPYEENGRTVKASMKPERNIPLEEVYRLITRDPDLERFTAIVRDSRDMNMAKKKLLAYVTPCGTFSYRNCDGLRMLSGLFAVDVDHLDSPEEAEELRDRIFKDPRLNTQLAFVSPGGRGVKAFIPYPMEKVIENKIEEVIKYIESAMMYVHATYDKDGADSKKGVDKSGKDIVRACYLCHDKNARIRKS